MRPTQVISHNRPELAPPHGGGGNGNVDMYGAAAGAVGGSSDVTQMSDYTWMQLKTRDDKLIQLRKSQSAGSSTRPHTGGALAAPCLQSSALLTSTPHTCGAGALLTHADLEHEKYLQRVNQPAPVRVHVETSMPHNPRAQDPAGYRPPPPESVALLRPPKGPAGTFAASRRAPLEEVWNTHRYIQMRP